MNKEWIPNAEEDILKIADIDASPLVDNNFKVLLLSLATINDEPYLIKGRTPDLQVIASPYSIQEALDTEEEAKEMFQERIDSLVKFCNENKINYIRFSVEV